MARSLIVRVLGYPGFTQILWFLGAMAAWAAAAGVYGVTLEGGDLEYLKEKTNYFAALLIGCVILTLLALTIAHLCLPARNAYLKYISNFLGIALQLYTVTRDLGTDLNHHGQFNLIVYFLMWLPVAGCYVTYQGCCAARQKVSNQRVYTLHRFWGILLTAVTCTLVYLIWSLNGAYDEWFVGLGGRKLEEEWGSCALYPPGVPWIAVLPHRTLNFFSNSYAVGSDQCPSVYHFSTLSDGVLDINCAQEVELIEQPDYLSMRNDTFVLTETGMELWANRTKGMEKRTVLPGKTKIKTQAEWMEVKCGSMTDVHIQNVRNESVVDRLISSPPATAPRMNLIVVMLDTVSRAQIYRKMPALVATLETLNDTHAATETFQFFRLFSNGFATEMNTKAMYTGSLFRRERSGRPYWDIFRAQGNAALYINGFCEDWMATFLKKEFSGADHFAFLQWCNPEYHPMERTFGNFGGPFSILRRCLNGKHVHKWVLQYVKQFWRNYKQWGKVVHIPLQEGHEGTGEVIHTIDRDFADFISDLRDSGELNTTVLVLTSDHGSHMGPYFMSGAMGEFEQRMPLLIMSFPKWFLDKYEGFRGNLRAQEQNIVSHYDTHWTLRHLATLPEFGGDPANYEPPRNSYTDVWDCEQNRDYMEVAYQFREKIFTRSIGAMRTSDIISNIETCFSKLNFHPRTLNRSYVPMEDIADSVRTVGKPFVEDAITDRLAYYWFLDAAKFADLYEIKHGGKYYVGNWKKVEKDEQADWGAWTTYKAPGSNRYLFGRSLLRYSEPYSCREAGIPTCPCQGIRPKHLRGSQNK